MTKIHTLKPQTNPDANLVLIDHLAELLEKARKAEITELIYAYYVPDDGSWDYGWTDGSNPAEALGAMEMLKDSYKHHCYEDTQ